MCFPGGCEGRPKPDQRMESMRKPAFHKSRPPRYIPARPAKVTSKIPSRSGGRPGLRGLCHPPREPERMPVRPKLAERSRRPIDRTRLGFRSSPRRQRRRLIGGGDGEAVQARAKRPRDAPRTRPTLVHRDSNPPIFFSSGEMRKSRRKCLPRSARAGRSIWARTSTPSPARCTRCCRPRCNSRPKVRARGGQEGGGCPADRPGWMPPRPRCRCWSLRASRWA